jgi:hypothetical protein
VGADGGLALIAAASAMVPSSSNKRIVSPLQAWFRNFNQMAAQARSMPASASSSAMRLRA